MRKLLLTAATCCLVLGMTACSSSKHSSNPPSSTTKVTSPVDTLDAATQARVCSAVKDILAVIQNVGTTPAEWQASATKVKSAAATMQATAPAQLATSAKAYAALMTTDANAIAKVTTKPQANAAAVTLLYGPKGNGQDYNDWLTQHCKGSV